MDDVLVGYGCVTNSSLDFETSLSYTPTNVSLHNHLPAKTSPASTPLTHTKTTHIRLDTCRQKVTTYTHLAASPPMLAHPALHTPNQISLPPTLFPTLFCLIGTKKKRCLAQGSVHKLWLPTKVNHYHTCIQTLLVLFFLPVDLSVFLGGTHNHEK